jgi:acyl dehydratase
MSISDDDGSTWSIVARNLPEHATNPIHTDVGAQAAGFERALVAGVTTYAYAVHPLIDRWGAAWVSGGMASLRLRSPVFDGDVIRFPTRADDGADEGHVSAHTPRQEAACVPSGRR